MSRVHTESQATSRPLPSFRWKLDLPYQFPGRALAAAILSIVLPGLGHLLIGERRRGLALLTITAVIAAGAVALSPRDPFEALAMLTQPRNLAGLLVADVAILAFRVFAVVDAFRLARPATAHSLQRPVLVAIMAVLLAVTAAPHIAVGYYDIVTYRFLDRVFNDDDRRQQAAQPSEVQLTREVRLKDGVTPAAPPVVADDIQE